MFSAGPSESTRGRKRAPAIKADRECLASNSFCAVRYRKIFGSINVIVDPIERKVPRIDGRRVPVRNASAKQRSRRVSNQVEVLVVGAGMLGCAAAYWLGKEGLKATVVERDRIATGHPA